MLVTHFWRQNVKNCCQHRGVTKMILPLKILDSYIGEFNSMKKAFYFCIPMCLLGGLFFLHASLNLLFDRDKLKRKDLKKIESIQLASYTNDNANI